MIKSTEEQLFGLKTDLLSSLLRFTQFFYKLRTGREFAISYPEGRESHYVMICRELTKVLKGETAQLNINIPPRYGKAIDINTPILTKDGWSVASDIKIGDELVGSHGWTKVTGVYPQGILSAKEITFSGRQTIVCNTEHLWSVREDVATGSLSNIGLQVLKTSDIEAALRQSAGAKKWYLPRVEMDVDELEPLIDSYTLYYIANNKEERFIKSIRDVEPVEMVCFTVDAPDKLFAISESLILTHNTELLIHFVAWALARHSDSNFLYISYSHSLATKQTQTIREIVSLPAFKDFFDVEISAATGAKDNFETTRGGSVYAAGSGGTITGRGAGIRGVFDRFGGAMLFDDIIKPDEATSDTIREGVIEWYYNTAQSRRNNGNLTPMVNIGQRVHEEDLTGHLKKQGDFTSLIIPALDNQGHALDPRIHTAKDLLVMKERMPYVFAAQYQQDPQPAGGGLFKPEWFKLMDNEPVCLAGFVVADTAETSKTYNDATVFTFFGIHPIKFLDMDIEMDKYGLYLAQCVEVWVEPKDLEIEFQQFLASCLRSKIPLSAVAIEKKSTGTTLLSVLNNLQGIRVIDVDRPGHINGVVNSKTNRFLAAQPYIAKKLISLPKYGQYTQMVVEHMKKITANDSHARDDIADCVATACNLELERKLISTIFVKPSAQKTSLTARSLMKQNNVLSDLREKAYGGRNW